MNKLFNGLSLFKASEMRRLSLGGAGGMDGDAILQLFYALVVVVLRERAAMRLIKFSTLLPLQRPMSKLVGRLLVVAKSWGICAVVMSRRRLR